MNGKLRNTSKLYFLIFSADAAKEKEKREKSAVSAGVFQSAAHTVCTVFDVQYSISVLKNEEVSTRQNCL
jgi:hypothetical protein